MPASPFAQQPTPKPGILEIRPYIGGEAKAEGASPLGRPIRLASNEGAFGASPQAAAAYRAMAGELQRYPDGGAVALREAIGRRHGLDPARIVCGAGSDELIGLLAKAYAGPGDEVLYSAHGFLMYPLAARAAGAAPVAAPERGLRADVDALLARLTERTRLVFLANPNNPTGSYLADREIERLHAELPGNVLLVLDAAYAEYMARNDYSAGAELVDRAANVVMTRTFSKIYGLAALRLGWAYCPPAVADVLNRVRGPFNVGAASQAAGVAALDDIAFVDAARAHNEQWRAWTAAQLAALGVTVHPSVANFVLVDFSEVASGRAGSNGAAGHDAEGARQFLKSRGILVRQMDGYGLPTCLRITIGTEEEMRAVIDALRAYLARTE